MGKKSRHKQTEAEPFIIERIIWAILNPIIKPFAYIYKVFNPEVIVTEIPLTADAPCYCGSNIIYHDCHRPKHKEKDKIVLKITKRYIKSGKVKVKYKVKANEALILSRMKPGVINALNKDKNYVDTSPYTNPNAISGDL
ncbi:hypothetical protein [Fulvivirga ligni]|uniref:hypothetical protein n=1 Tax=Fulvivirga ligni TaxID=2904246 RepID=UPI001F406034|nr:hypothetical protein [Fulvivirga ligni]UII20709.1 hypothetical protein LVD16_22980 [Fulvivirga ligni]